MKLRILRWGECPDYLVGPMSFEGPLEGWQEGHSVEGNVKTQAGERGTERGGEGTCSLSQQAVGKGDLSSVLVVGSWIQPCLYPSP
jgi:hypothetical protein